MPLLVCASFLLFVLSAVLPAAVTEPAFKCSPGEDDCSKCYFLLVANVTDDDRNQFNLQYAFFPPNFTSPVFVTVHYRYDDDHESGGLEQVWFWSTSTFYLFHPLHVFQFTSLFFSNVERDTAELYLTLHPDCQNATEESMVLLTQRLKLYAMRQSIASPIDDSYDPRVESVKTFSEWHENNTVGWSYIFSHFVVFPFPSYIILILAVWVINDHGPTSRMSMIKKVFEDNDEKKEFELKCQLQNEFILSFCFVLYALAMSASAVAFSTDPATKNHLNGHINEYFSISSEKIYFRVLYSLSFVPLIQDGFVLLLVLFSPLFCILWGRCHSKCQKWKHDSDIEAGQKKSGNQTNGNGAIEEASWYWWRLCAYGCFFSLACILNHLNFILISFIHDLYHATSITIVYGLIIVVLILMLNRVPAVLCCCFCFKCKDNSDWWGKYGRLKLVSLFVIKCFAIVFFSGLIAFIVLLYYYIPIDNFFDEAGNNFISIYHTVIVLFTAMVAYFIIKKPFRSTVSIFTKALEKKEGPDKKEWANKTAKEKDMETAKRLLKYFK